MLRVSFSVAQVPSSPAHASGVWQFLLRSFAWLAPTIKEQAAAQRLCDIAAIPPAVQEQLRRGGGLDFAREPEPELPSPRAAAPALRAPAEPVLAEAAEEGVPPDHAAGEVEAAASIGEWLDQIKLPICAAALAGLGYDTVRRHTTDMHRTPAALEYRTDSIWLLFRVSRSESSCRSACGLHTDQSHRCVCMGSVAEQDLDMLREADEEELADITRAVEAIEVRCPVQAARHLASTPHLYTYLFSPVFLYRLICCVCSCRA